MVRVLVLLLPLVVLVSSYKFLLFDLKFLRSHVQFVNGVADILVDAGHEVHALSNVLDPGVASIGSSRLPRYVVEQTEMAAKAKMLQKHSGNVWATKSIWDMLTALDMDSMSKALFAQCERILTNTTLLDALREEKFDVGFTAFWDRCSFALFHAIGIEKVAIVDLHSSLSEAFVVTGAPAMHSYVPGHFSDVPDCMCFFQRATNFVLDFVLTGVVAEHENNYADFVARLRPDLPSLKEIMANASLVFINRNSLVDFPSVTTHKVIDIGGITVGKAEDKALPEEWETILAPFDRIIIISFGTIALSVDMPETLKEAIRQLAKRHPDVGFVWKYERPEDNVSNGISNLLTRAWLPQKELLRHSKTSLFITHGGISSTWETLYTGLPIVAIPTNSDQYRNARMLERNGVGVVLSKEDFGDIEKVDEAVMTILNDESFRENSRLVAKLLEDEPFSARDKFIRNMEFLARHGPLHQLNHEGTKMEFTQYYLVDVFALLLLVPVVALVLVFSALKSIIRCAQSRKAKRD